MSDPSRHADNRNAIESLMRSIPGFKGYLEREYRRDSDRLARDSIVDQLGKVKVALDRRQRTLLDSGQIDAMPAFERIRSRVDRLQSRVRGAVQGYSGFFDFVRIDESVLDDVYRNDLILMDDSVAILNTLDELSTTASVPDTFKQLEEQLDAFEKRFDQRGELLRGISR